MGDNMNTDNKNTELNDTDKKIHISDVRNSVELMLENEKNVMNYLASDKLLIYHNDTYSFSRDGKQNDLDKAKYRVSALEDVLKHCF